MPKQHFLGEQGPDGSGGPLVFPRQPLCLSASSLHFKEPLTALLISTFRHPSSPPHLFHNTKTTKRLLTPHSFPRITIIQNQVGIKIHEKCIFLTTQMKRKKPNVKVQIMFLLCITTCYELDIGILLEFEFFTCLLEFYLL